MQLGDKTETLLRYLEVVTLTQISRGADREALIFA